MSLPKQYISAISTPLIVIIHFLTAKIFRQSEWMCPCRQLKQEQQQYQHNQITFLEETARLMCRRFV